MGTRDEVMPNGRWQFDEAVTEAFDDMLRRCIPQYQIMRQAVFDIGQQFTRDGTAVVDLGCSRGGALAPFVYACKGVNFVGVEISEPMAQAARSRFTHYPNVEIVLGDLRTFYPSVSASLTLAVLTLQFVPIEYRQAIVRRAYEHTWAGGAFILVEKVLGGSALLDTIMVDIYLDMKRENGYTDEQIDRKRLALEGALVPVTAAWNEDLLRTAGFSFVDCFWRWQNFAAWVAVKE